jgi:GNAT superfamily N-acetyltransferase
MSIEIRNDVRTDYVAGIVQLHIDYYVNGWGFGGKFVQRITGHVTDFVERYDADKDLMLTAHQDDKLIGSLIMDCTGNAAKSAYLRWFIIAESGRGQGLGALMMNQAMTWCDDKKYDYRRLSTYSGLKAAHTLYVRHGFKLVSETDDDPWGAGVGEQIFEWRAEMNNGHAA